MASKMENGASVKGKGSIMGKARQIFSRKPSRVPKNDEPFPPYEPFTINPDVLQELHDWNRRHPSDRLPSVLDRIARIMESKPLVSALDAIPQSPFPVGPLVKSLMALISFGIRVPKRKKDAFDFAMQVVTDLNAVAEALGAAPPDDKLLIQCKVDLVPFCAQVNEICSWAADQLRSTLAASTDEEQAQFQTKTLHAKVSFLTLSTIRIMREISLIGQDVGKLLSFHDRKATLDALETELGSYVATQYEYHRQSKEECHPVTRDVVLSMLDQWLRFPSKHDEVLAQCYWLLGIAGVGKTAIAMTTVECLLAGRSISPAQDAAPLTTNENRPVLCAHYFCNHLLDSADIQHFFPTLAMQLANRSPAAAHMISSAIRRDPTILHKFGPAQAEVLFLNPLRQLAAVSTSEMLVIVIDGVDELRPTAGDNPAFYGHVTKVIGGLSASLPSNVRILVLSRPESKIVENIPVDLVHRYDLPTTESVEDVERYFNTELPKLGNEVGLFSFPSEEHEYMLCKTAAGHLGWAKQAVNWLYRRLEFTNGAELDQEIRDIGALARGDLDQLYRHFLLRSLPPDGPDRERFTPALHAVLSCLAVLRESQSIRTISQLLALENDFNILNCFKRLSSVYASGNDVVDLDTVPQPHKSFYDFLSSSHAPSGLVVEPKVAHRTLASTCLNIMRSTLHFNMRALPVPRHIHYACARFGYHVQSSDRQFGDPFLKDLIRWIDHQLLYWMEVYHLRKPIRITPSADLESVEGLTLLQAVSASTYHEHSVLWLQSAKQVVRVYFRQRSSHTTLYTGVLPFHTALTPLACISVLPTPLRWIAEPQDVLSFTVSCDGDMGAVANEGHLSVFSVITGTRPSLLLSRGVRKTKLPPVLRFSSGGSLAVAALEVIDNTSMNVKIVLVDTSSGEERLTINSPLHMVQLDSGTIEQLLFSPKSDYLCVLLQAWSEDQLVYVFRIYAVADGCLILERSDINHILGYLNDIQCAVNMLSEYQTRTLLINHTTFDEDHLISLTDDSLTSLGVSRTGTRILAGRGSIYRVELETEARVTMPIEAEDEPILSVGFSPEGDFLALGYMDGKISLWSTSELPWVYVTTLHGHIGAINQVVVRSDTEGKLRYLISSSEYGIRIWDVSAAVQGRKFDMPEAEEGVLADPQWFKYGIMLGGWGANGTPFVFQYPFKLPPDILPLNWDLAEIPSSEPIGS